MRIIILKTSLPSLFFSNCFDWSNNKKKILVCSGINRWSNQDYSASDFEEYQKHFTVMNFLDDSELQHVRGAGKRRDIHKDEFIPLFNSERGGRGGSGDVWGTVVVPRLHDMIIDVFNTVKSVYADGAVHPSGASIHPNAAWSLQAPNVSPAKAMYGFDVLLTDSLQPVLMEVQWAPDCSTALKFYPTFWDSVLGALYLDEEENVERVC